MKPVLDFRTEKIWMDSLGEEASVPDLMGGKIQQNQLSFSLGEEDEIFEGYGKVNTSFPYRQFSCYHESETEKEVKTAVLENEYLKAVFLPEFGGRLWSLWDKKKNRNLLYTNDGIRFRNLAVRNAWFSGGVEWNIGVIGHTPLTTAPLFTARLLNAEGDPVLRMYEYERIREVTYQMDFWLEQDSRFLNCRMRIENASENVVPMYWWSNTAVPELPEGRLIVPARRAYTNKAGKVYKVDIPVVDGIDVTRYRQIPKAVDYFFELLKGEPRYLAHVDGKGDGLLHCSTDRLQARKLFCWGNQDVSARWQEFLTRNAGKYVEVQAGLAKTQYGCLPMAPHTAWEWMERFGAVSIPAEYLSLPYDELMAKTNVLVREIQGTASLENTLQRTKTMAKTRAEVIYPGSGFGALKSKERAISGHLDFGICGDAQKPWAKFLETGLLHEPEPDRRPELFVADHIYYEKLKSTILGPNSQNWYAHYHLGLLYLRHERYRHAQDALSASLRCRENPWAYHALAALKTAQKCFMEASAYMEKGILLRTGDLSYVKEAFSILLICRDYGCILRMYQVLAPEIRKESRMRFYRIQALAAAGKVKEAYDLLHEGEGFILEDLREGEDSIDRLWQFLHREVTGKDGEMPHQFHFTFDERA